MTFLEALSLADRRTFEGLDSPSAIQGFLDSMPYVAEELDRSPLRVMQDRQCHCLDGGYLAALALNRLGFRPRVVDLAPAPGMDDDHVLAVFQVEGCWGALAKSNYTGLRYREPVYRSLRELVMSYFALFFSLEGELTLRGYTRPMDLSRWDRWNWQTSEAGFARVAKMMYSRAVIPLLSEAQAARLQPLDRRSYDTYMTGVNLDWAFGGPKRVEH